MTAHTSENQPTEIDLSAYKSLFLEQATAFLHLLLSSLEQLQENPGDAAALREGRRATHTLKGMAAIMQYHALAGIAARLELPFLDEVPLSPEQIDALRGGCQEFEAGLARLEEQDGE